MEIRGLIWYAEIIEKLETRHGVEQDEVRQVLRGSPKFRFVEKGHRPGENVYSANGQTESGRYLLVFFVYKKDKHALILSARDMEPSERKMYEKK
ncbi:MAG: BrnT family toxin [Chloroflexota bacterium]